MQQWITSSQAPESAISMEKVQRLEVEPAQAIKLPRAPDRYLKYLKI